MLENLLDEKDADEDLYADSAYSGKKQRGIISEKEINDKTCKKGYKNNPITDQEQATNREKSRTRSRVEHIFGFMETSMNGMNLYAIGIKRIDALVGLMY